MLVLSRRRNEAIVMDGGRIEMTVVGIHAGKVRLAFKADDDVEIHRQEVYAKELAKKFPVDVPDDEPIPEEEMPKW